MTIMITEVYDAFKSAGADDEKAREAATAIAHYRDDITKLEHLISEVKTELKADISEVKSELNKVKTELKSDISEVRTELRATKGLVVIGFSTIFAMLIPMFWKIFTLN